MTPAEIAVIAVTTAVVGVSAWRNWKSRHVTAADVATQVFPQGPAPPAGERMALEAQIAALADAGLPMNPGVSVDDLLHSFPREEYEIGPWHCLLVMYGSEIERPPDGRLICDVAWNFDAECIGGPGSYVAIVAELARVVGVADKVTSIADRIDMRAATGEVAYVVAGTPKRVRVAIQNDWADPAAVAQIMRDLEEIAEGRRFWGADNGQASVMFALTDAVAAKVNAATGGLLGRLL